MESQANIASTGSADTKGTQGASNGHVTVGSWDETRTPLASYAPVHNTYPHLPTEGDCSTAGLPEVSGDPTRLRGGLIKPLTARVTTC